MESRRPEHHEAAGPEALPDADHPSQTILLSFGSPEEDEDILDQDSLVRLGEVGEEFAFPGEEVVIREGSQDQETLSHEDWVQLASEVVVSYLESLKLPPTLHYPTHKVAPEDPFKLLRAVLNNLIRVQRTLAVSVSCSNLLLNGFPPDVVQQLAEELLVQLDTSMDQALKGLTLHEMIEVYKK